VIGVLRRAIGRVGRLGAYSIEELSWAIARPSTSDDPTRNTESENTVPVKSVRDFVKEAKAEEDPYIIDFGGEVGEVRFRDPAGFSVEDQFNLHESESPRKALQLYIGAEAYDRAWPVIKTLKITELNDMMSDVREHFRSLRSETSA
jgi:hypothetical protein